jgi:hypothetical protein
MDDLQLSHNMIYHCSIYFGWTTSLLGMDGWMVASDAGWKPHPDNNNDDDDNNNFALYSLSIYPSPSVSHLHPHDIDLPFLLTTTFTHV